MDADFADALRGREPELRTLDGICNALLAGDSSSLLIRGEAGIGKTALLHYLAHVAAPACRVAHVVGMESEMELAYAGLHQLCAPMLEQARSLPQPQRQALSIALGQHEGEVPDRFLLGLATLGLLAEVAHARPLVCVVDDVQWVDDATCEVLGFVARRLRAESVALVFGWRDELIARHEKSWFRDVPEMAVQGLADDDARALLATVVPGRLDERIRDRIVAETRGNPLALVELPRGMTPAELAAGFGIPMAGGVAAQLEHHYLQRIRRLPESTQTLLLLAAADSVGDATTIWRAASTLGIGLEAAAPAASAELFEIGDRARFRHPLVRSASYHSASAVERRAAHQALAAATDPDTDPDRRAWHRANAASGPDAGVADELAAGAERAAARGGYLAAAALLERSASLTPDPAVRPERRLAAAEANLRAGAFAAAVGLLAVAEAESREELTSARIQRMRGLVAGAANAGGEAPLQLLSAAKRLEQLNTDLSHRTYSEAWLAAFYAGHLTSPGADLVEVSRARRAAPASWTPRRAFGLIHDALMYFSTEGSAAAQPLLREALGALMISDLPADRWLQYGVEAQTAAALVWDFDMWSAISQRLVKLARDSGALADLPRPLSGLTFLATWRGDCTAAASYVAEHNAITAATGSRVAPHGALLLAAYQGPVPEVTRLLATTTQDSLERGEGTGVDLARWSAAILYNSVGRYAEAFASATPADPDSPGLLVSTWMLPERVESGVRCNEDKAALHAAYEFEGFVGSSGSDWGLGLLARAQAMVSDGDDAEAKYRESVERLGRAHIGAELARSRLVYGEWLRRENRRVDARVQLRDAHETFVAMSAGGFADRARRELLATGEKVRSRRDVVRTELTAQEEHIARLARDGHTNPEIASELFISARTVEWHLRKVFTKLGISSRRGLRDALPEEGRGQGRMRP